MTEFDQRDHGDSTHGPIDGAAAIAIEAARRAVLYRKATRIQALANIARDCAVRRPGMDLARSERLIREIAALAGDGL
jgi:hypothetical protein